MKKVLTCLVVALMSFSAMAAHHNSVETEVRGAVEAFNGAYGSNNIEAYFSNYADGAMVYFFGARQKVSAYRE